MAEAASNLTRPAAAGAGGAAAVDPTAVAGANSSLGQAVPDWSKPRAGHLRPSAWPEGEAAVRLRRESARERLRTLPLEWAAEAEQAMVAKINASASEALRQRLAFEEAKLAGGAAWGEPLVAACGCSALLLLLWVRRRRVRRVLSNMRLADLLDSRSAEDGAEAGAAVGAVGGADAAARKRGAVRAVRGVPASKRPSLLLWRCLRRLVAAVAAWVVSPSRRLSTALRRAVHVPKRRSSDADVLAATESDSLWPQEDASAAKLSQAQPQAQIAGKAEATSEDEWRPSLLGSSSDPPSVMSRDQHVALSQALPHRLRIRDWELVYSTEQHGCSLRTLTSRAERHGASVLLALDSGGHIFGAFVSQPWRRSGHYFGTGESFVFTLHPRLGVHRWTRENSLFAVAGTDFLAVGGGGGYALWLDSSLEQGTSQRSATFGNPTLASSTEFRCVKVELWAFQ